MQSKELLKEKIEKERRKLDKILEKCGKVEDAYMQSLVLDQLIEQYLVL